MHTSNNITFIEIHELFFSKGRVIMFQIPAAPNGVPVAWKGHYFGRNGESLVPLNLQKIEFIRSQAKNKDWSAEICDGATINDLDSEAIAKARHEYKRKHPKFAEDVDIWDDITFLNKAKVTIQGKCLNVQWTLKQQRQSATAVNQKMITATPAVCAESSVRFAA